MENVQIIGAPNNDFSTLRENLLTIFGLIVVLSFVVLCVYLVVWVILYLHKYLQSKKFGTMEKLEVAAELPLMPEPTRTSPSSDFRKGILLCALAAGSFLGLILWRPTFSSFVLLPLGLGIGYLVLWRTPK